MYVCMYVCKLSNSLVRKKTLSLSKIYKSEHCLGQQLSPLHKPQLFLQFVFIHVILLPELHSSNNAQDGHLSSASLQSAQHDKLD